MDVIYPTIDGIVIEGTGVMCSQSHDEIVWAREWCCEINPTATGTARARQGVDILPGDIAGVNLDVEVPRT